MPAVVFAVLAARYGVGSHDADLPSPLYLIRASEYQVYWEVLYFISSTIVKCAVGFACIRLDSRKRVSVILSINMLVMVVIAILALVFVFANCKPFAATWNPALYVYKLKSTVQVTYFSTQGNVPNNDQLADRQLHCLYDSDGHRLDLRHHSLLHRRRPANVSACKGLRLRYSWPRNLC